MKKKTELTIARQNEAYHRKKMEYYIEEIKILEEAEEGSDFIKCECGTDMVKMPLPNELEELYYYCGKCGNRLRERYIKKK